MNTFILHAVWCLEGPRPSKVIRYFYQLAFSCDYIKEPPRSGWPRLSTHSNRWVSVWMVSGCALETEVCHWMFKSKANMVQQGEGDFPLNILISET